MIEHDLRVRERLRQIDQIRQLRLEQPRIEGEPERVQMFEPFAEGGVAIETRRMTVRHQTQDVYIGVVRRAVADAAEAAIAGMDMRAQHIFHGIAQPQIRVADDSGRDTHLAIDAAGRHGGDTVHEFRLAHAFERIGSAGAIHRTAFEEHGRADVVPALQVLEEFVEQIARIVADDAREGMIGQRDRHRGGRRTIPEMMMRIDDRKIGFEDRFARHGSSLPAFLKS